MTWETEGLEIAQIVVLLADGLTDAVAIDMIDSDISIVSAAMLGASHPAHHAPLTVAFDHKLSLPPTE
jgi:hypothetical protein